MLSFTTTLSVAADAGAERFACEHDAALAVARSAARAGQTSLSPASVWAADPSSDWLVLPSPNGSTIAHHLAGSTATLVGSCLRNAAAVTVWLSAKHPPGEASVAIISAGERWPCVRAPCL